ncbi:glycosyltransferase family 2 protein [Buttiauxella izardii]|uniref:Glycosyltransferase family 2 protein n=1 Tax=Buttiauxella izardii TaxID=82991 RepID=A0A3A5K4P3_9ENTR|nr:glycosyltransferase [Buttiauxella izardii]RJT27294.1 glycosyltransferase family 2 protein [Buttiauxella izardii]
MLLSVVIPVWKRVIELSLILNELNKQAALNDIKLEVILCDSHSGIEIEKIIDDAINELNSLTIRHLHTENIVAAKRNLGIKKSSGQYLIFLDDDCIPGEDFLNDVVHIVNNYKENTVYCGEVRFVKELVNNSNYYRYRDSRHPKYSDDEMLILNEWTFVSMNCLISRDILERTQILYNENFLGYGCEDHEFPWQLMNSGVNIIMSKQMILHHEHGGDIIKYSNKIRSTARDGMLALSIECPELFASNKKINAIENIFIKSKSIFSKIIKKVLSEYLALRIAKLLIKNDRNKIFYIPLLYRYILLCSYLKGCQERETIDRKQLLKNWYL